MQTQRVLYGVVQMIPPWTREMSIEKLPPQFLVPLTRGEQGRAERGDHGYLRHSLQG